MKRKAPSESEESEATETAAPQPPATAAEVMKQLDDHISSIYEHYLSTRNCPPDFHGLHEHLYFHHEVRARERERDRQCVIYPFVRLGCNGVTLTTRGTNQT